MSRKVGKFINVSIPKDLESDFLDHLSFNSMSKNSSVNFESIINNKSVHNKENMKFIRQGEAGTWNRSLTPEQVEEFDEWSHKAIAGTGFPHYC
ncbi:hypothetical protein GE061_008781 [Apolygus lucorum]|uniref:Sulfotransferase domain-containing protein n=1 Tax=Apolygus lucorum TaxID=248454 RepID=A0A6A4K9Q6_APOLU|nr:hypothetical protein GE061_008781 [Apolygus lucorum]